MSAYDIDGIVIANIANKETVYNQFSEGFFLWQGRNTTTGTNYSIMRIFQKKADGSMQFPFVYAPNGVNRSNYSTLSMNIAKGFPFAINAGVFNMSTFKPMGTLIQNGILLQQGDDTLPTWNKENQMVLTIDNNGLLGYAAYNSNGNTLISNGIVSAVHSFCPIVIDYEDAKETISVPYLDNDADAMRQVFGQFGNGDYCVVTAEGRDNESSVGFTVPQLTSLCLSLGLRFAFNLDGGGSTETVLRKKQINTIYEGPYGREVPNFIVFNGTTQFKESMNE